MQSFRRKRLRVSRVNVQTVEDKRSEWRTEDYSRTQTGRSSGHVHALYHKYCLVD